MQPLRHQQQNELLNKLSSSVPVSEGSSPDSALPWAAILSAAATIGSNIYSNWANDRRVERQNQLNLEQWNRENAYNDPSAQMQRLRRAGINPALAFANGDIMNEAAPSPQMMANRVVSPVNIDPLVSAKIDNLTSQAEKNRSEIPVNEQRANELKSSIRLLDAQARGAGISNDFAAATFARRVSSQLANDELSEATAKENMRYVNEVVKAQYEEMLAKAEKAKYEGMISQKEYDIIDEKLKQEIARTSIEQYNESMKEFSYWFDKGSELLSHVENVIGLIARFKFLAPSSGSIITEEYFDKYGEITGGKVSTSKPAGK